MATALPDGSKIGNRTRALNESCWRPARLTNPRPESVSSFAPTDRCARKRVPLVGRPSEPELTHELAAVAPRSQVVTRQSGVWGVEKALVVPVDGV